MSGFSDMDMPGFDVSSIPGDNTSGVELVEVKRGYQDDIPLPLLPLDINSHMSIPSIHAFHSPPPPLISPADSGSNSPTFGSYNVSPVMPTRRPHQNGISSDKKSEFSAGVSGEYILTREGPPRFVPPPPPNSSPPPLRNDGKHLNEWTRDEQPSKPPGTRKSSSLEHLTREASGDTDRWVELIVSAEKEEGTLISIEKKEDERRPSIVQLNKAFKSLGKVIYFKPIKLISTNM